MVADLYYLIFDLSRGKQSLEVIMLLFLLKIKFKKSVSED